MVALLNSAGRSALTPRQQQQGVAYLRAHAEAVLPRCTQLTSDAVRRSPLPFPCNCPAWQLRMLNDNDFIMFV
jgi:hypothetical protein